MWEEFVAVVFTSMICVTESYFVPTFGHPFGMRVDPKNETEQTNDIEITTAGEITKSPIKVERHMVRREESSGIYLMSMLCGILLIGCFLLGFYIFRVSSKILRRYFTREDTVNIFNS